MHFRGHNNCTASRHSSPSTSTPPAATRLVATASGAASLARASGVGSRPHQGNRCRRGGDRGGCRLHPLLLCEIHDAVGTGGRLRRTPQPVRGSTGVHRPLRSSSGRFATAAGGLPSTLAPGDATPAPRVASASRWRWRKCVLRAPPVMRWPANWCAGSWPHTCSATSTTLRLRAVEPAPPRAGDLGSAAGSGSAGRTLHGECRRLFRRHVARSPMDPLSSRSGPSRHQIALKTFGHDLLRFAVVSANWLAKLERVRGRVRVDEPPCLPSVRPCRNA